MILPKGYAAKYRRSTPSPEVWAQAVFGRADLGDVRRTRRVVRMAAAMARYPLSSFSGVYEKWSESKGAYRLIENSRVRVEALRMPSQQAAVKASRGNEVVLAVSDTTALNFTNHRATSGLGAIGETHVRGLWFHSTLLLRSDGTALGLVRQQTWVRTDEEHGKGKQRKQRPIQDKESFRWVRSVQDTFHAFQTLPEEHGPYVIHIFDREGDIHEVFEAVVDTGQGAVIRSARSRRVDHPQQYLHEAARNAPVFGSERLEVPRRPNQPRRYADVVYRSCAVTLAPPAKSHPERRRLDLNVVAVIEPHPPASVSEPLEWILVTTEPIDTLEDVQAVVRQYRFRWRIEEYHLILKSGCRIEKLQFETVERIEKVLAILAPVAVRLLQLTYWARVEPEQPCTLVLSEDEWRALQTRIQKKPPPVNAPPPTLRQAVLWIGRLGGHLGRKSDGMPGVRTLWKGWRDLQLLTVMYVTCMNEFHQQN